MRFLERRLPMLFFAGDEAGGSGGATAVADPPETETVETTETVEEMPEETEEAEETPGGQETPEGASVAKPQAKGDKTVPLGALVEVRRENAELKKRLESLEGRFGETSKTVDALKPPEKDALELWYEKLPEGRDPSQHTDAKAEEQEAFGLKQDAGLMLRVMKHPEFRRALLAPIIPVIQQMFRSLDLNSWQTEQAMEALGSLTDVEIGQPELDAEGKVLKAAAKLGEKLPIGVRHRARVLEQHKQAVEKSGGRWVPVRDVFATVQQQLKDEEAAAGKVASQAAEQATTRTLREVSQRRTAAGSPGNVAPAPRGGPATPKTRTFAQIESPDFDALVP